MKNTNKKLVIAVIALAVALACTLGVVVAYLTDFAKVTNTFTVGKVAITLTETDTNGDPVQALELQMMPGRVIDKDPKITVEAGSEESWIFVQVNESDNLDTFITYALDATDWTPVSGDTVNDKDAVYAYKAKVAAGTELQILVDNKVTCKDTVTSDQMDTLTTGTYPTLTFIGFAVQAEGFATAQEAWDVVGAGLIAAANA